MDTGRDTARAAAVIAASADAALIDGHIVTCLSPS